MGLLHPTKLFVLRSTDCTNTSPTIAELDGAEGAKVVLPPMPKCRVGLLLASSGSWSAVPPEPCKKTTGVTQEDAELPVSALAMVNVKEPAIGTMPLTCDGLPEVAT